MGIRLYRIYQVTAGYPCYTGYTRLQQVIHVIPGYGVMGEGLYQVIQVIGAGL